jgi:AraC family transcriptional regulator of adaptative response / DNA-3-methyladenine glycosylase II
MQQSVSALLQLSNDQCQRAACSHDPRFDGVFFIGVTTTRIYCRPICPARVSISSHRRFFVSAAAAERAGYRPCLRCRPELAPGRAPVDAMSRLAFAAAARIGGGALNGCSVADLARDLSVSERHLRRALERAMGVSPLELAQTHRLLLAKRLLADTALSVTDVAFASGFQSLRRFNTVFRERYRLCPSRMRRATRVDRGGRSTAAPALGVVEPARDVVRLTLAYRPPLGWDVVLRLLERDALPGVEHVDARRYLRAVRLDGRSGVVSVTDGGPGGRATARATGPRLDVEVSLSLLPALMPLLARLRQLFDLDADPVVIDAHLAQGGLAERVARCPGIRVLGALEPFDVVLGSLVRGAGSRGRSSDPLARVVRELGEPIDTGIPALRSLAPTSARVADAGPCKLVSLGVPPGRARALATVAGLLVDGGLSLAAGSDVAAARRALLAIEGISDRLATRILTRTLYWPDAFAPSDAALQRAAGASGPGTLRALAQRWRPWRAYAALHLELGEDAGRRESDFRRL